MKILIGWFGHETNAFSRKRTDFDLLCAQGYWKNDEMLTTFTSTPSYLGGMIKAANEYGVEVIPTFGVENAGPILTTECLERTTNDLVEYCRKYKNEFDGICLGLHGAGVSEDCNDIEGYVLEKIRNEVGYEMPITVTLDLHANISKKMCELSNGLFCIKENPHTDYSTTGYEAMKTLVYSIKKNIRYKTDFIKLPLIMPLIPTVDGILKNIVNYIKVYKVENNLADLSLAHGFCYSNNKDVGVTIMITTEEDMDNAKHLNLIGKYVWDRREYVNIDINDEVQAMDIAIQKISDDTIIVVNESSDNPGAGTPGDGTHLLKELIKRNISGSAFAYLYDPEFVNQCFKVGIGNTIKYNLGGKIEDEIFHGKPLEIIGEVTNLSDGSFISTTPLMKGIPGSFGKTACIQIGNVKVVIASVQNQTYDDRAFFVGNIDVKQQRLICLKSSQHFKAFYNNLDTVIISADPSGIASANLKSLPFNKIKYPVYPLNECVFEDSIIFQKL